MSSKKRSGGRVTAKGTQPPASPHKAKAADSAAGAPRAVPGRVDPTHSRSAFAPPGTRRAGPRGGNR